MTVVMAMAFTVSAVITHRWTERESVRSAVHQVQSHLRLGRIQAIARNQTCRFVIDEGARRIQVFDVNDPGDPADDLTLADLTLSRFVVFERPDPGAPITLTPIGGGRYQATFTPRGSVSAGSGQVAVKGGDGFYYRVRLLAAGGVTLERWTGSSWMPDI